MLDILLNILATAWVNILNFFRCPVKGRRDASKQKKKKKEKYILLVQNEYNKSTFPD